VALALTLALPFVVVFCVFGDWLIRAWVGVGHEVSYLILVVLALTLLLQLQGSASFTLMTATEKNELLVKITVISAPVNVALSFMLTRAFGPIGPALGSLVTALAAEAVLLPVLTCRQFGFSYRRFLQHSLVPLLLPTVGALALALAARSFLLSQYHLPWLIVSCAATMLLFWGLWLFVGIEAPRRQKYLSRVRSVVGRSKATG
jgi:O-antigen/teichoic acid export membrane protein